ncbi:MAG: Ig-like domain-containing protein [Clostridia bacterium]|nr:Ig-like domain-containing protein [Clostridia bacterium]
MKVRIWVAMILVIAMLGSVAGIAEGTALEQVEPVIGELDGYELASDAEAWEEEFDITEPEDVEEGSVAANPFKADDEYYGREDYDRTFYKKSYSFSETIYLGDTIQLWKVDGAGNAITVKSYQSSKTSVATIADEGSKLRVYPRAAGSATITAKATNGYTVKIKLTVKDPYAPEKVSFSSKTVTVNMGSQLTLKPVLEPSSARTTYTWKSSRTSYATVSSAGVVTPLKEGSATITVTTANKKKATITVKIVDPYKPTYVTIWDDEENVLDKRTITMPVGGWMGLEATSVGSNGEIERVIQTKTWKNSNSKVVSLYGDDEYAELECLKEGTAKITVTTYNKKSTYFTVKVVDPYKPNSVSLPSSITLNIGDSYSLTPTLSPSTARTTYTWSTSSKKIATVNGGYVTALAAGKAKITVKTANGKKATCTVTVNKGSGSTVSGSKDLSVYLGQKLTSTAKALNLTENVVDEYFIGYYGNNFGVGSMYSASSSNPVTDTIFIYGPCSYNFLGIGYGTGYLPAISILQKNGWQTDPNDYSTDYLSYHKGKYEISIDFEGGAATYIYIDEGY